MQTVTLRIEARVRRLWGFKLARLFLVAFGRINTDFAVNVANRCISLVQVETRQVGTQEWRPVEGPVARVRVS